MKIKRHTNFEEKSLVHLKSLYILYGSTIELDLYDAGENIGLKTYHTLLIVLARGMIKLEHFGEK